MEEKELKEKLIKTAKTRGFVCEAPSGKVKDLQLTFNQKELLKLISEELDKAREEGVEAGMVNAREMVSAFLDTLDVDKNEEEIRILRGINQLLEAITGLALKLKDNKQYGENKNTKTKDRNYRLG